jgi:hypothetical protein
VRIVSTWTGCDETYARLARVLEHSARRYNPTASVEVVNTDPSPTGRGLDGFLRKARDWTRVIAEAVDGTEIALLDADTLVLGELGSAFRRPFDVAVTTRGTLGTLNSGVVFVRISDRVRDFFAPWAARTEPWCKRNTADSIRFGDQDALIEMLGEPHGPLRVLELPAAIWNAQQNCWPPVAGCRIVHIKSDCRRLIFGGRLHGQPGADVAAAMWQAEEQLLSACHI